MKVNKESCPVCGREGVSMWYSTKSKRNLPVCKKCFSKYISAVGRALHRYEADFGKEMEDYQIRGMKKHLCKTILKVELSELN